MKTQVHSWRLSVKLKADSEGKRRSPRCGFQPSLRLPSGIGLRKAAGRGRKKRRKADFMLPVACEFWRAVTLAVRRARGRKSKDVSGGAMRADAFTDTGAILPLLDRTNPSHDSCVAPPPGICRLPRL
jgi:hypothetical protein